VRAKTIFSARGDIRGNTAKEKDHARAQR